MWVCALPFGYGWIIPYMINILQYIINGVSVGSLYALVAVGILHGLWGFKNLLTLLTAIFTCLELTWS